MNIPRRCIIYSFTNQPRLLPQRFLGPARLCNPYKLQGRFRDVNMQK
jgi:hypothetical protein